MTVTAAGYRSMTEILMEAAAEVCDGRLVRSHEGGYSPVYTPFCGLAVLEQLSGHDTRVGDHPLTTWQDEILRIAEERARRLRFRRTDSAT
ncbi:hypothetical protein ACFVZD_46885 [Streptomyces sp. NPDC058287]|uniref:hypothetical protein n=1 Tax=unclassified Streptomyces TaxID=2593676 RepID=UPI0036E2E5A8